MSQKKYVAAIWRRELHDMLLCTVVQHAHTHHISRCDREIGYADCVKFGTQALLRIETQILCPIRPVGFLCHIITPKIVCRGNSILFDCALCIKAGNQLLHFLLGTDIVCFLKNCLFFRFRQRFKFFHSGFVLWNCQEKCSLKTHKF